MASLIPPRSATPSSTTTGSTSSSKSSVKQKKEKWRAPGRGGAGSRVKKAAPKYLEVEVMHVPHGREIALPPVGSRSMTGRGGTGNTQSHYVDPQTFNRVLQYENGVIQAKSTAATTVVKSGRGGSGNILKDRNKKQNQQQQQSDVRSLRSSSGASTVQLPERTSTDSHSQPVLTMSINRESLPEVDEERASPASSSQFTESLFYVRKRSLSVGSTVESLSSAYTGLDHSVVSSHHNSHAQQQQGPRSAIPNPISSNFLLGRKLRPGSSSGDNSSKRSSDSGSFGSASNHLPYLHHESSAVVTAATTPATGNSTPSLAPTQNTTTSAPMSLFQRMRRGGSHPGLLRTAAPAPGIAQVALQTNSQTNHLPVESDMQLTRDSVYSITSDGGTSLSDFPLPPPSPAVTIDNNFPLRTRVISSPPPSVHSYMSASSLSLRRDLAARPPPTGPLPVPPALPPPSAPLPPVPGSPPITPTSAGSGPSRVTPLQLSTRAHGPSITRPRTAPSPQLGGMSLAGRMPQQQQLLSPTMTPVSPSPTSRPPPLSPSSYFTHRPSVSPQPSSPSMGTHLNHPPASQPATTSGLHLARAQTSSPMTPQSPVGAQASRRGSVTPRDVFTPQAAPEKTAALVRALSLGDIASAGGSGESSQTQSRSPGESSTLTLSMSDSDEEEEEEEDHVPGKVPPRRAPLPPVTTSSSNPRVHSHSSLSPPSSLSSPISGFMSPPLSPRRSSESHSVMSKPTSGSSSKSSTEPIDPALRSKLALAAIRRERERAKLLIDNPMLVMAHRPGQLRM
ncbi:hypothetical protein BKA62DRAFT_699714 [Auriculariales sp. MPI-PUGE-AT-0066]|nr:hypothetical protein BKA62DRAFT_699714 [Auriculariales sp. MPI-PUGE-AT-0066]